MPKNVELSIERKAAAIGFCLLVSGLLVMFWTTTFCHDCNETCVGCSMQVPPQIPYCWLPTLIGIALALTGIYNIIHAAIILFSVWWGRRFHG